MNGKIIHRCGIKVLDGTESFEASIASGIYRYKLQVQDIKASLSRVSVLSTHFKDISSTTAQIVGGIFSYFSFVYIIPDQNLTTVTLFKQWLSDQYSAGKPVILLYPLETPTTETVTPQPMNIQEGTNIVQITQASMDDLELEVKYKAGVEVTITEIQNAQLDNNVEVIING